jgi:hypothetical protein
MKEHSFIDPDSIAVIQLETPEFSVEGPGELEGSI